MDWLVRFIQISCWIEIISMHVNAQQAVSLKPFHGPDWQNWDELDLQTRLFSRLDATWIAQGGSAPVFRIQRWVCSAPISTSRFQNIS
jgi:hypothetical protein